MSVDYDAWFDGFLHGKIQMIKFINEYLYKKSTWRDVYPVFNNTRAGQSKVCDVVRLEEILSKFEQMYCREIKILKELK